MRRILAPLALVAVLAMLLAAPVLGCGIVEETSCQTTHKTAAPPPAPPVQPAEASSYFGVPFGHAGDLGLAVLLALLVAGLNYVGHQAFEPRR
ncbi:MAG: hypothetical protein HY319_13800 [Armatimonadetes bacterium]|nr:hypothetical protein [Armatimonadota bacterium]